MIITVANNLLSSSSLWCKVLWYNACCCSLHNGKWGRASLKLHTHLCANLLLCEWADGVRLWDFWFIFIMLRFCECYVGKCGNRAWLEEIQAANQSSKPTAVWKINQWVCMHELSFPLLYSRKTMGWLAAKDLVLIRDFMKFYFSPASSIQLSPLINWSEDPQTLCLTQTSLKTNLYLCVFIHVDHSSEINWTAWLGKI